MFLACPINRRERYEAYFWKQCPYPSPMAVTIIALAINPHKARVFYYNQRCFAVCNTHCNIIQHLWIFHCTNIHMYFCKASRPSNIAYNICFVCQILLPPIMLRTELYTELILKMIGLFHVICHDICLKNQVSIQLFFNTSYFFKMHSKPCSS